MSKMIGISDFHPYYYRFQGGFLSTTASDGSILYVDIDANGNIIFATTKGATFQWAKASRSLLDSSGQNVFAFGAQVDGKTSLSLVSKDSGGTNYCSCVPVTTTPISRFIDFRGLYKSIPGPIQIAATNYVNNSIAWVRPTTFLDGSHEVPAFGPVALDNAQDKAMIRFYYQGRKIYTVYRDATSNNINIYYLQFQQSNNTFGVGAVGDIFTWSNDGSMYHENTGLPVSYTLPSSYLVLPSSNQSVKIAFQPQYAFDVTT